MTYRIGGTILGITLLVGAVAAQAAEKSAAQGVQQLEKIKRLTGDWYEIGPDGKPSDKLISSIRVTAAGSAVQETLFPGTEKEMVTMYFVDGEHLVLTHYCILGNQPRMRAEAGKDPNEIAFKFIDGTNIKDTNEHHMNKATLTVGDPDRFQSEWVSCMDGKACHQVKFNLARKSK